MALELSQAIFTVISYLVILWIIAIAIYILFVAVRLRDEILGRAEAA